MIRVERGAIPGSLSSAEATSRFNDDRVYYRLPARQRGQRRRPLTRANADVLAALVDTFHGKCAYCESPVAAGGGTVDRFRPRENATGGGNGTDPDHYWWLAWEWRNLYLTCMACNRAKASGFPVDGPRAPLECPYDGLATAERALLLDPCQDDPEQLLVFDESGRVVATDVRAMTTIDLLSLNRKHLVKARRNAMERARDQLVGVDGLLRSGGGLPVPGVTETLLNLIAITEPYSASRRQVVRTWAGERGDRDIADPIVRAFLGASHPRATVRRIEDARAAYADHQRTVEAADATAAGDAELGRTRFIESIELVNIRGIERLSLHAPEAVGAPCLTLVGENGTGKTTILQAVAVALMGADERRRLRLGPAGFLRHGARDGLIRVSVSSREEPFELRLEAGNREFIEVRPRGTTVPVMAYGPTRLLPQRGSDRFRSKMARVDNLFNPRAALTEPASWLGSVADDDWFRRTAIALRTLLPVDDADEILRGPPVRIRLGGDVVRFAALSAGYQAILALAADVMRFGALRWGARSAGALANAASGVLIVDEIDAHLHPRWKLRVLSDLRALFPNLQLLVTTHDPLTLRGLDRGEVAVLARDADGVVRVESDLPSPKSMRIDQLLTSEFFGLASTRDLETDALLREYQSLVAHPLVTDADRRRLAELEADLSVRELMGHDAREQLLLRAADQYLGRHRDRLRAQSRPDGKDAVDRMLAELWESTKEPPS